MQARESRPVFDVLMKSFQASCGKLNGEGFNIIGTSEAVNYLIEVALFLKQELLLIACNTLRECIGSLEGNIKRSSGDRVNSGKEQPT